MSLVAGFFVLSTGVTSDVEAERQVTKKTKDFAALSIGPLKVRHRDGQFDPENPDRISYPGIFGSSHYLSVGRRNDGFGGSVADFELRIPRSEGYFDLMFSRRKGGYRIINHLYTREDNPDEIPARGVFLNIDYRKVT